MMKDTIGKEPLFYELIRVALGTRDSLSHSPSAEEWDALFVTSQEQAVAGVAFLALDTLNKYGQKPQQPLLYEWIGISEQIKQKNQLLNKRCVDIIRHFEDAGFRCCILKGQGNAQMYPQPLLRTPGDIDIWLDGDKETIENFIRKRYREIRDSGIHLDYPFFKDVDVEVHYRPQYLSCRKYDKRLQNFFSSQADAQFKHKITLTTGEGEISIPFHKFNFVLQMAHLLGHFYGEGIGMRQFVDMYYLLVNMKRGESVDSFRDLLYQLGMGRFSQGVMWIEKEMLGLDERYLVVEPSEKLGRIILSEIEKGGNFGQFNARNEQRKKGILTRAVMDSYRLIQLSQVQPSEAYARLCDKLMNVESMKIVIRGGSRFCKYLFWPQWARR